jgi:hypothetical protein
MDEARTSPGGSTSATRPAVRTSPHGVGCGQMLALLHETRAIAALEEVPVTTAPAVEVLRVDAVQVPHRACKVRLRGLQEQVVVVAHQAGPEHVHAVATRGLLEDLEEPLAVGEEREDRPALVPTRATTW